MALLRERWDTIFVYSDMQAGNGGLYGTNPREYADYLWGKQWGKPVTTSTCPS